MSLNTPSTTRQVAEAVLFDQATRRKLVAYAHNRFRIEAADAEDLLQDTAFELLRQRSYVRRPEGFAFAAFRARCARFVGACRARRGVFADAGDTMERVVAPSTPEALDRQIALRQGLARISLACQRILAAYYVEGQDLRQAARALCLAHSSAAKTISRCLHRLWQCVT